MRAMKLILKYLRAAGGSIERGEKPDSGGSPAASTRRKRDVFGAAPQGAYRVAAQRHQLALIWIVIVVLGATALRGFGQARTGNGQETIMTSGSPGEIRAGHVLVRFNGPPSQAVLEQLAIEFGARVVGKIAGIDVIHLQAPPERGLALVERLRSRPDVEFAEFDSVVKAIFEPNDPYYSTPYASSHN